MASTTTVQDHMVLLIWMKYSYSTEQNDLEDFNWHVVMKLVVIVYGSLRGAMESVLGITDFEINEIYFCNTTYFLLNKLPVDVAPNAARQKLFNWL